MSTSLVLRGRAALRRQIPAPSTPDSREDGGLRELLARLEVATRCRDADAVQAIWKTFSATEPGAWLLKTTSAAAFNYLAGVFAGPSTDRTRR